MKDATRGKLKAVSTATLCTALYKRGLRNQFIQDVRPLNAALPNMVGPAFTPGAVFVIDSRKNARRTTPGPRRRPT